MSNPPEPFTPDAQRHALISRLARRVREVRKQKGLPRRVLSEMSGVSPRYLAQLEAGEGNISVALLERVARALDVPIEALISRRISVDPEVQRMAALIENAAPDVRAQVMALLAAPKPAAALRRGRICLLGPYGPEKTRVATMLGEALGLPVVELSAGIERETGMPLAEVRSLYGPDGFRRLEAEALEHAIAQTAPVLLTVSDGLAAQAAPYARLLERFHTVWLHTTPRDQMQTSAAQDAHARLLARVHAQVDVSGLTSQQCVDALFALCSTSGFSGKFP